MPTSPGTVGSLPTEGGNDASGNHRDERASQQSSDQHHRHPGRGEHYRQIWTLTHLGEVIPLYESEAEALAAAQ